MTGCEQIALPEPHQKLFLLILLFIYTVRWLVILFHELYRVLSFFVQ
jgi:hypothetical protein